LGRGRKGGGERERERERERVIILLSLKMKKGITRQEQQESLETYSRDSPEIVWSANTLIIAFKTRFEFLTFRTTEE
jgi:hypothetical protein